jgi:hypothetical protein
MCNQNKIENGARGFKKNKILHTMKVTHNYFHVYVLACVVTLIQGDQWNVC